MSMLSRDQKMIETYIREVGVTRCPTVPSDLPEWGFGFPPIWVAVNPEDLELGFAE